MTSGRKIDYQVGQKLWFQSERRWHSSCVVTVKKIGRKWVKLDSGVSHYTWRVAIGSVIVDAGEREFCRIGELWNSEAEARTGYELYAQWEAFKRLVHGLKMPADMTVEKIAQVRALVGMDEPGVTP